MTSKPIFFIKIYWSDRFKDYFFEQSNDIGQLFCLCYDINLDDCVWSHLYVSTELEFVAEVSDDK